MCLTLLIARKCSISYREILIKEMDFGVRDYIIYFLLGLTVRSLSQVGIIPGGSYREPPDSGEHGEIII